MAWTKNGKNLPARFRLWLGCLTIVFSAAFGGHAFANTKTQHQHGSPSHHLALRHGSSSHRLAVRHSTSRYASTHHHSGVRYAREYRRHERYASAQYRHSGLQCVPYAREVSQINLSGNAFLWWAEASGRYARGSTPVEGAVLNFRAVRRMPLGHVAVVTSVIDSRTILVTQANWIRGTITNDVTMQDVSPNNDWTQVEVELGDTSTWGAAYPTYGFIYNQPATSTVVASSNGQGNAQGNAAGSEQGNEVAEAPRAVTVQTDAPNRNLQ